MNRIRNRVSGKQKNSLRRIALTCAFSATIAAIILGVFNLGDVRNSKANEIQVIHVGKQEFTNDMTVAEPFVNHQEPAGPNTIFIQTKKVITPAQANEE